MIAVGDYLEAAVQFIQDNANRAMNVFHFVVTDAGISDPNDFCNAITDDIAALYNLWLASNVSGTVLGTTVIWRQWNSFTDTWQEIAECDFNFIPLAISQMLPQGAAGVVKFPGANGGRMGRKFVYGLVEANQSAGELDTTVSLVLAGWGADMAKTIGDVNAEVQPIIWQGAGSFNPMTGTALVDSRIGYQRRRKQGVGW